MLWAGASLVGTLLLGALIVLVMNRRRSRCVPAPRTELSDALKRRLQELIADSIHTDAGEPRVDEYD
jgi:hypothetical protein